MDTGVLVALPPKFQLLQFMNTFTGSHPSGGELGSKKDLMELLLAWIAIERWGDELDLAPNFKRISDENF